MFDCVTHPRRWLEAAATLLPLVALACSALAAEKPATAPEASVIEKSAPPARDSEAWLIQRRAARLRELPAPPEPPQVEAPTHNAIDQFIVAGWREAGLKTDQTPDVCDDATFVRRVYLDLIGVIPTATEANRYLAQRASPTKRAELIDQLLARRDDYAAHWAPFWEEALGSQPVQAQGGIPTRGNYREWIVASLADNRPYDVMVAELIDPTMPGRKRATEEEIFGTKYTIDYVRNEDHTATLQTAANIGQVFLGTSMKCASCHDHFENKEWSQDRFLGFAGLFAPHDLERIRCEVHTGHVVPARFPFDLPGGENPPAPAALDDRLQLAARAITDPANPRFARTIVNRLWKRYLGTGLFEPADDYRDDVAASHPQLLDWLAYDFLAHGCDLPHTIRLILNSRTYQLRYDPQLQDTASSSHKASRRLFRSPALRRLTAEQLIDSIRVATAGKLDPAERCYLDARSTALTRALGRPASRNEISTSRSDDLAVVQSLELLNGAELHAMIYESPWVTNVPKRQDATRTIDRLYRAVLSRPASTDEKRLGKIFLNTAEEQGQGIGDTLWALIASPEFQYIK